MPEVTRMQLSLYTMVCVMWVYIGILSLKVYTTFVRNYAFWLHHIHKSRFRSNLEHLSVIGLPYETIYGKLNCNCKNYLTEASK